MLSVVCSVLYISILLTTLFISGFVPYTVYLSAIRPMYCSVVWHHELNNTQVEQLEAVQRRAIRVIFKHYQLAMACANFSSLHARREDLNKKIFKKIC